MVIKGIKFQFVAIPRKYEGSNGWYYVSLPQELAKEIRGVVKSEEQGWGRLKATAKIGSREWKPSIWFDTKMETYLLSLKAKIRKNENLIVDKVFQQTNRFV